jgi:hypothetical protein
VGVLIEEIGPEYLSVPLTYKSFEVSVLILIDK